MINGAFRYRCPQHFLTQIFIILPILFVNLQLQFCKTTINYLGIMSKSDFLYVEFLCDSLNLIDGRSRFSLDYLDDDSCLIIDGLELDLVALYNLISLSSSIYLFSLSLDFGSLRICCRLKSR